MARGYLEFEISDQEYGSSEMAFLTFSMLESRGYTGFTQLLAVLNDPEVIFKLIRLMYGMDLKIPPLEEFNDCLRASIYAFSDMYKKIHINLPVKPLDIRGMMNLSEDEEKRVLTIFDEWAKYMYDNNIDPLSYLTCNRNNTKKRIQMGKTGKKWTRTKY